VVDGCCRIRRMGIAGSAPRSAEGDGMGFCTVLGWAQDAGWRIGDVTLGGPRGFIRDEVRDCRNMKLAKVLRVIVKRRE
jgi:hypothetical protein